MRNPNGPIQVRARQFAHDAGFDVRNVTIKTCEAKACHAGQTAIPCYDVWVKESGAKRGHHIGTLVMFVWPKDEFAAWLAS